MDTEVDFDPNVPSVEVAITTIDDSEIENAEHFLVNLHTPITGVLGDLKKTVVIIKDVNTPSKNL